ncbi:MAG: helix-turn-helix domain-containing protein, partial [Gammaproteobacteria bacterium]
GENSIYLDTTKGCWVGEIALGHSVSGRRLRRKVYGATKTEVREQLRKARKEIEAGVTTSATYTVADAVRKWMTSPAVKKLAPKTREKFRTLADNHLLPQIGKAKLRDLTADDVEEWLENRAEILTTRTLRELLPILRRSIVLAMRNELVARNVAALGIVIPNGKAARKSRSLTLDQAVALVAAARASRLYAYIVVSLFTGIRTEEARALAWDRVCLTAGGPPHIEVWRSVRVSGGMKTEKSRRTLELPAEAADALKAHKVTQEADRRAAGVLWEDTGLVFASTIGTGLDAANVRRQFRAVVVAAGIAGHLGGALRELREQAGLRPVDVATRLEWDRSKINGIESGRTQVPKEDLDTLVALYGVDEPIVATLEKMWRDDSWTPRELRHSFVSLLSAAGVRLEDISRLAGHANTRVTEVVYHHELRPVLTAGAAAMSTAFAGAATLAPGES